MLAELHLIQPLLRNTDKFRFISSSPRPYHCPVSPIIEAPWSRAAPVKLWTRCKRLSRDLAGLAGALVPRGGALPKLNDKSGAFDVVALAVPGAVSVSVCFRFCVQVCNEQTKEKNERKRKKTIQHKAQNISIKKINSFNLFTLKYMPGTLNE